MQIILISQSAKSTLKRTITDYTQNLGAKGLFAEDGFWTAFDNSSGNCWVESFRSKQFALAWLAGRAEASEENEKVVVEHSEVVFSVGAYLFVSVPEENNNDWLLLYHFHTHHTETSAA